MDFQIRPLILRPANPIKPEPNNRNAPGNGTGASVKEVSGPENGVENTWFPKLILIVLNPLILLKEGGIRGRASFSKRPVFPISKLNVCGARLFTEFPVRLPEKRLY